MAVKMNIHRVLFKLPDVLEANSIYLVAKEEYIPSFCDYATPEYIKRYFCPESWFGYGCGGALTPAPQKLMDMYVVGNDTTDPLHVINTDEINWKIKLAIGGALQNLSRIEVVPDIAARDALPTDKNKMVMVLDASADPTVNSGSATYVLDVSATDASGNPSPTWYKISEYESLDQVFTWDMIQGKPLSLPVDIDDAVAKRHTHANKAILDVLSDGGNNVLVYNGKVVTVSFTLQDW